MASHPAGAAHRVAFAPIASKEALSGCRCFWDYIDDGVRIMARHRELPSLFHHNIYCKNNREINAVSDLVKALSYSDILQIGL